VFIPPGESRSLVYLVRQESVVTDEILAPERLIYSGVNVYLLLSNFMFKIVHMQKRTLSGRHVSF